MTFNSFEFIFIFAPVTITGFWLLARMANREWAMSWLILTSIVFCAFAGIKSLAVIVISATGNYLCARTMLRSSITPRLRAAVFSIGICLNIAFLVYFKSEMGLLHFSNKVLGTHFDLDQITFPLGVSFLTFQMIAFIADVYRRRLKDVRWRDYLLFASFFPRVVAGPIVRYGEVAPQFSQFTSRTIFDNVPVAICLFSIGLFKKAFIADGLGPFVTQAFDPAPGGPAPSVITAWFAAFAFSLQIYFDFSGYTDMALGVARIFGVRLPMNFNSPFKSTSVVELWSRSHITLTLFLTDYIYAPLTIVLMQFRLSKALVAHAPNRFKQITKVVLNCPAIFITTVVSGFWHGSTWPFILWGVLHGFYLSVNQIWRAFHPLFWADRKSYERAMKPAGFVLTLVCSTVALVFFRANSVDSALSILRAMAGLNGFFPPEWALLNRLGIDTWSIVAYFMWALQLTKEYVWIIALLLVVTLAPNTMEILRRFQPALNFHTRILERSQSQPPLAASGTLPTRREVLPISLRTSLVRNAMRNIQEVMREGIHFNRLTAMLIALLSALGILALNDGVAFIYARF
jgi:D-alanyl-lipoteichoic acid acyltransferase DltB (MBOAT superfamily)